ncbi:RNA polymerase sigma factor [Sphingomonas glacialis]|uniref:RNA polymerase sigma factor n=1 Tax=Sphingomonas glacialis TaxID=658225 RepID=A0A502G3P8_9SPHN|nr:RNA polymerase sigma factor [Sphingomonas glacialis]TPG56538.1 RNA polymerase sigma factor [Sphingomonas glacialis]
MAALALTYDHAPQRLALAWRLVQNAVMDAHNATEERAEALAERFASLRGSLVSWFTRRVSDAHDAEDLVQESFLRVAQQPDLDAMEHLDGYIYRTAANVLTDRYRHVNRLKRRAVLVPIDDDHGVADEIDPHRDLAGRLELDALSEAMMSLPERTRVVFILRRVEGLRYKEIGIRLGISVSAVEKHVTKALELLALRMESWQ